MISYRFYQFNLLPLGIPLTFIYKSTLSTLTGLMILWCQGCEWKQSLSVRGFLHGCGNSNYVILKLLLWVFDFWFYRLFPRKPSTQCWQCIYQTSLLKGNAFSVSKGWIVSFSMKAWPFTPSSCPLCIHPLVVDLLLGH